MRQGSATSKPTPKKRHIDARSPPSGTSKAPPKGKATPAANPSDDRLRHHAPRRSVAFQFRAAVHEAGHAVTRLYLGLGVLERITIDGAEGGGVSWRIDELDDQTEELLTAAIVTALAGRAAEEEIIGTIAIGSGGPPFSDLAYATDIAFQMEATLGLGQKWPLLHRPTKDRAILFALDPELAARVNARLETAYGAAKHIVARQRDAVEYLAAILLSHRTLEGAELERILAPIREHIVE